MNCIKARYVDNRNTDVHSVCIFSNLLFTYYWKSCFFSLFMTYFNYMHSSNIILLDIRLLDKRLHDGFAVMHCWVCMFRIIATEWRQTLGWLLDLQWMGNIISVHKISLCVWQILVIFMGGVDLWSCSRRALWKTGIANTCHFNARTNQRPSVQCDKSDSGDYAFSQA